MSIIIKKPWGQEEILETNDYYTVKRLTMMDGHQCSKQYHNEKKETIYVIYGTLTVYFDDSVILLDPGNFWTIEPKKVHRMSAKNGITIYLECSTSQLHDVVRLEDDYERDKK
jgi:mannose-6-phosphate isomerase